LTHPQTIAKVPPFVFSTTVFRSLSVPSVRKSSAAVATTPFIEVITLEKDPEHVIVRSKKAPAFGIIVYADPKTPHKGGLTLLFWNRSNTPSMTAKTASLSDKRLSAKHVIEACKKAGITHLSLGATDSDWDTAILKAGLSLLKIDVTPRFADAVIASLGTANAVDALNCIRRRDNGKLIS
jgi:hypothetical protein